MGLITNRSHSLYCKANIRQLMLNFTLFISPGDHHSASPSLPASLPPILPLSLYFLQCLHVEVKLVQQLRVELGRRLLVECGNFTQIKYRQHRERQVCRGEMFQPVVLNFEYSPKNFPLHVPQSETTARLGYKDFPFKIFSKQMCPFLKKSWDILVIQAFYNVPNIQCRTTVASQGLHNICCITSTFTFHILSTICFEWLYLLVLLSTTLNAGLEYFLQSSTFKYLHEESQYFFHYFVKQIITSVIPSNLFYCSYCHLCAIFVCPVCAKSPIEAFS